MAETRESAFRTLDSSLTNHYGNLIDEEVLPNIDNDGIGSQAEVLSTGFHALKIPYDQKNAEKNLERECKNGRLLNIIIKGNPSKDLNVKVPTFYGVERTTSGTFFLIMDNMSMKPYSELNRKEQGTVKSQFEKMKKLAKRHGMNPIDINEEHNCGYDPKTKSLVLYDSDSWELN